MGLVPRCKLLTNSVLRKQRKDAQRNSQQFCPCCASRPRAHGGTLSSLVTLLPVVLAPARAWRHRQLFDRLLNNCSRARARVGLARGGFALALLVFIGGFRGWGNNLFHYPLFFHPIGVLVRPVLRPLGVGLGLDARLLGLPALGVPVYQV